MPEIDQDQHLHGEERPGNLAAVPWKMISPRTIAKRIGVSTPYLSCFNREQTGENLMEYVARCRIAWLRKMMEIGSATIEQVSWNVGYISPLTFRGAFLK
jgi:AraC-like DNA-binding protein